MQRAEKVNSQNLGILLRIGRAYTQMRDWERAETAYQKVLERDHDNALAYQGLSHIYHKSRRFDEAADAALTSVGLLYHQPLAHFYLGSALVALGYFERAEEAFLVAMHQAPGMRRAYEQLANLYENHLNQPTMAENIRQIAAERIESSHDLEI